MAASSSRQIFKTAGLSTGYSSCVILSRVETSSSKPRLRQHSANRHHARTFSSSSSSRLPPEENDRHRYNYNTSLSFSEELDPEHIHFRRVTASELTPRREPPTKVKMLVRDFIDDSLYNPNYGYFSRNATIFTPPSKGYDFASFSDQGAFQEAVAQRYERDYGRSGTEEGGLGRQVWHTPTELFKPYYCQALTQAIVSSYKFNHYPDQDLVIYEVGAGNGSFMVDSLAYIRDNHPDVYERTRFRAIELSAALARRQRERTVEEGLEGKVEVIESDFFRWMGGGSEPCYVVALEVLDNFAHDMIRYDLDTLQPLQAIVSIDATGDFTLLYQPVSDPLLSRVLSYRRLLPPSTSTRPPLKPPLLASSALRKLYTSLPFAPNLSQPDFIPSKAVLFLERLRKRLPNHRLLVADFSELPEAVKGRNGPVVQTRYGQSMVPCETFLVKQGYFDIFFPTNFELLGETYSLIMNSPSPSTSPSDPTSLRDDFFTHSVRGFRRRQVGIHPQTEFLRTFGGEEVMSGTRTRDGISVLEGMYGNAKIMF